MQFRKGVHWKDWCWSWNSNTLATSCEELTHWKRPWRWEGLGAGGEGDNRGWDGWMASQTQLAWVWVNSGSLWWTGRPGMLQFMGLQRVKHDWVPELNWTELNDNPVCETAKETQMYWTVFWTLWERTREGWYGRMVLKHVNYHMWNESPVQVWRIIQGSQGWCTGMTQRDGMGRGVGGRFRMGNTCTPTEDSYQWMAKPIQCCIVK